jgi:hypothetical protein
MEWTRDDRQQQINNQPLIGVAKAGRDKAVKAKAAPAMNRAFCCRVDHGGIRKAGTKGRGAVEDRQQWQRRPGNNQLKSDGDKWWP